MTKEILKQFKDVEDKIGATALERLKDSLGNLIMKLERTQKSLEKYKDRCNELHMKNDELKKRLKE